VIVEGLAELGFEDGHDNSHKFVPENAEVDRSEFFDRALDLLHRAGPIILEDVLPRLEEVEDARWNPGGFMVYPVGVHPELGPLRFHIYPPFESEADGPFVHDHALYLSSLVLEGTYTDEIIGVSSAKEDSNKHSAQKNDAGLYVTHRSPGGPDTFTYGGEVDTRTSEERVVEVGQTHTIDPGVFHLPTVSPDQLAATLVLDSHPVASTTRVIMPHEVASRPRVRKPVTREQSAQVSELLTD